jgi:hypothetical protein
MHQAQQHKFVLLYNAYNSLSPSVMHYQKNETLVGRRAQRRKFVFLHNAFTERWVPLIKHAPCLGNKRGRAGKRQCPQPCHVKRVDFIDR